MTHLRIELNAITENVTSSLIHKLYEEAKIIIDNEALNSVATSLVSLKGNLQTPRAYRDEVEWLESKFPNLHINVTVDYYFKFKDPVVHEYFASRYGDGVGLTESALSNITSVGDSTFYNNTEIESFDELSKMNVKYLENYTFYGCSNLKSIDTSNIIGTYKSGGTNATHTFHGCSKLEFLDLSNFDYTVNGVTIPVGMCSECSSLKKVILGKINSLGGQWETYNWDRARFGYCTSLTTVDVKSLDYVGTDKRSIFPGSDNMRNFIIRSETVPQIGDSLTLTNINFFGGSNVTIYVPDSAVDTYKNASGWENVAQYIQPLSNYVEE